ncbi:hypothetical protein PIB30_053304 [Stylosanthes scabra]|uniref:Uncharacterized protein n=1 Tax=Stylosanthes scabra TaxID=79078 RepID=A0ABU6WGK7_9FABA|nr:hypothetical protein [Stylosanthes scabra]
MLSQQTQPLPKPPINIPNRLPSQPLPNPKEGLNALNDKMESREEAATTNDSEVVQQLCEMLIEVTDTEEKDTGEIFDFYEEFDSDYKEEETKAHAWLPAELRDLRFHAAFAIRSIIVSIAGIIEDVMVKVGRLVIPTDFHVIKPPPKKRGHPQVLLGRPFLKTSGFKFTYADDIFTFSSGRTTETFQISLPPKKKDRQDDGRMRGKEEAHIEMIEALIRELLQKLREEEGLEKEEREKETKGRCQVEQKKEKEKSQVDCLSIKEMFNEMEQILYHNKGADTHLIRNNSKWK